MKILSSFLFLTIFLMSCDDRSEQEVVSSQTTAYESVVSTNSLETRTIQPTILGEQKQNPFSVENMKIALDTLKKIASSDENNGDIQLKSVSSIEIDPTDLYVRFLPEDSLQFLALKKDTSLSLFDHPLDYEIKQNGDYYFDPTVETKYTWQYAVVKPNFNQPKGIKYEVLSQLFIVEHSPYYTETIISADSINKTKSATNSLIDRNICNALYAISFKLTGNEKELKQSENELKSTYNDCKKYCVKIGWWKACWSSCGKYYIPDGYIKVNTPNGDVPLKGIKVRMWRWFSQTTVRTDANGYYRSYERFSDLWIGNSVDYEISFSGVNGNNSWYLNKTIFTGVCLWTDWYGAGWHSPNGHSMTFYTNSDYWGKCVISNAIYDYVNYAKTDGISLPPSNLEIANSENSNFESSAPLFNNHIDFAVLYAYPNFWGLCALMYQWSLSAFGLMPDLILKYTKNINDYNRITATVWHELTHSSQLTRMMNDKGLFWASDYWSANVYQQASNSFSSSGSPYGKKGDTRWQMIALSEGWSNYRVWLLSRNILSYDYFGNCKYDFTINRKPKNYDLKFPKYFAQMFVDLQEIGCRYSNMEKSLPTYSFSGFRDNLIKYHSSLSTKITSIVNTYENLSY